MSLTNYNSKELLDVSKQLRLDILKMVIKAKGGHIGGSFSIIDVLTALYLKIANHDPSNPEMETRDRVVFSKGHSCLALYNILAKCGYFPKEHLEEYCTDGGRFAGHPERELVPGAEATTGSLGHGLPIAVGMGLARNMDDAKHKVFCILGDGECNEGSVWEALMAGSQFELDCLTAIIDSNKLESLGRVEDILSIEPLPDRLMATGWSVREIDGHNMDEIVSTLSELPFESGKPSAIIAHTVKGKGVSFMENVTMWHYRGPTPEEAEAAFKELEAQD